jgi:hypothetical protein
MFTNRARSARFEPIDGRIPSEETAAPTEVALMSVTTSPQTRAIVPASQYRRVLTLLVAALVAVVGLAYAVIVLASETRAEILTSLISPQVGARQFGTQQDLAACAASAETGARLNHSGHK